MSLFRSLMMAYVALASSEPIDLSLQDVYGNPINRSTANCYVISKPGRYKFPVVYGNAIKNGEVNTAAFTNNGGANSHDFVDANGNLITQPYIQSDIWNLYSRSIYYLMDKENLVTNASLVDGDDCFYVEFEVPQIPQTGGNAILAVQEEADVLWSWHIWVWPHDLTPVEITNNTGVKYKIMPVNLASKYDDDGVHIKNWFYQWGRKDPMLLPSSWNSATDHESYYSPRIFAFSARDTAGSISQTIWNPTTFYYNSDEPYNWFGTKSYYNLWDAACTGTGNSDNDTVKTVYDPCPVGWKVPNGNTFTGLSILSSANGIVKMRRYSGDTVGVDFPLSGYRRRLDGSLNNVGSNGYVWLSSAYSQNLAYSLYFDSSYVNPQFSRYRTYGLCVRPVQDSLTDVDPIIILFTIDGTIYAAESGMTWRQWVNSTYNTYGFMVSVGGSITSNGQTTGILSPPVGADDIIQKGTSYTSGGSTTPSKSISTNLNNQWQASSVSNPDSSLYDIYESYSNYNVNYGTATMTITISGMTEFTCYIRSNAESNYDYVMISQLDLTITGSTSYSNTTLVKAHTRGNQQSGTAFSNYTAVTYSGIDGGEHTITVVYRKDSGVNYGTDKGYILIPKSNEDLNNKDLITFTINHVKEGFITGPGIYQAERGMTFDEWFFSSYNKIETYVEDTCNLSYSTVGDNYPKFRIDGNGTWWEWRFTNYTGNTVLEDGKDYEFVLY